MNENLTSLGVGGIIVFLVIRELFAFLKTKKANGSGDKPTEYWEMKFETIGNKNLDVKLAPMIDTLKRIEEDQKEVRVKVEVLLNRRDER